MRIRKKAAVIVILFLGTWLSGCGKKTPSDMDKCLNENSQRAEGKENIADAGGIKRDVYFLDDTTLFSAEFPENWHAETAAYDLNTNRFSITCVDSELDGFRETNFFYLHVKECQEKQSGEGYTKSDIEMADGQEGCVCTKEYYDDDLENHYYAERLLLPGERFFLTFSEYMESDLMASRYQRNKGLFRSFYRSILYQEQAERIGREQSGKLAGRERVGLHLHNQYLNIKADVPEGMLFDTGFIEYYDGRKDFWLRLYLDETKKNYVEFFSDQHGFEIDYLLDCNGFRADFLDNGEQAYCYDWRGTRESWSDGGEAQEFLQYRYSFKWQSGGAHIQVEKEEMDLLALAQKIVKSVVFP